MRILHVMAGGKHGGAETAFVDTCIAMHQAGWPIEVVTRKNDLRIKNLQKAGVRVHILPFGGKVDFYTRIALLSIIKKFKPDIVQTWMSRGTSKTPKWHSLLKKLGISRYKVVARLGNYYGLKYYKSAEYFIAITPDIKTYLEKKGIPPNHVKHINNLAETPAGKTKDRASIRESLKTPPDACVLVALGRLHEAKAFDTLITAIEKLPDEVHLWIAGEGPERNILEKLIIDLGVEDRVTLLGWRDDRADLFAAADICVFPSRFEPFGTVFVQAWAHKIPLITTAADGPRQFVRNDEDGLIVPIDDAEALAKAILRLKDDQDLQKLFINKGFERYKNEFSTQTTLKSYMDFYQKITQ